MSMAGRSLKYTPVADIPGVVRRCRAAFDAGRLRDIAARKDALRAMDAALVAGAAACCEAAAADFRKPAFETRLFELRLIRNEIAEMLAMVDAWAAPQRAPAWGAVERADPAFVRRDPLGAVLVIGAWNYPFQLTLTAVAGALAAGNTVVVKPSELSPASAAATERLVAEAFDPSLVTVVQGAIPETAAVLEQRFDHIMYTGSARVGKVVMAVVMAAAARHLTPVTLELGGKSPVYVGPGANVAVAARRIMWGRTCNAGQTCVAPDYLLVDPAVKPALVAALGAARAEFLGDDPAASPHFARMVNDAQFDRVAGLMAGGKVVVGGETDAETRFIAPTVLDEVDLESPLMTEEIFGPLLPMVDCGSPAEAVAFINAREKPLALYVFDTPATAEMIISRTSSGAVVVNDTLVHAAHSGLPFGGVGHSGMGGYHGKHTFDTFSHRKAVLYKQAGLEAVNQLRYPPYTDQKLAWVDWLVAKSANRFGLF